MMKSLYLFLDAVFRTAGCRLCCLCVSALVLLSGVGHCLGISNVKITDLSPRSFSVVWQAGGYALPGIEIFADEAGGQEITSRLEVVPLPFHGGDPFANPENWQERYDALRSKAAELGSMKVEVNGCTPATTYYFRVVVSDGNSTARWPLDTLLHVTTPAESGFVMDARLLRIELVGSSTDDPSGWLVLASSEMASAPVSAFMGDGAGNNQAIVNLSNFYLPAGSAWLPDTPQVFTVSILPPAGDAITQEVTVDFDGTFSVSRAELVSINLSGVQDSDGDGIPDSVEASGCTDPFAQDSDGDGVLDGYEDSNHNGAVDSGETNPCLADSDGDGLDDGEEILTAMTDPLNPDSDGDGYDDYEEFSMGSSPLVAASVPDYSYSPADIDMDGDVDNDDLDAFAAMYGKRKGEEGYVRRVDVNRDNILDDFDLAFINSELGFVRGVYAYDARFDFDDDDDCDGKDAAAMFVVLGKAEGDSGYEGRFDFTGDGIIDIRDIALFAARFGTVK